MTGTGVETAAHSAVASVRAGVDALLSVDLEALSGVHVAALLADLEVQRRRLEAVDQRILAAVEDRRIAGDYARASTAELLITLLRVSPVEAKARTERARDMGPRRSLLGQHLDPIFARVAAAQRDGEISAAHARVVTDCVSEIPAVFAAEAAPVAEQLLVEASRHCEPGLVARTGKDLLVRLNPDGVEPADRDLERRRTLTLRGRRLSAELTDATAAVWRTVLDALSAPQPAADGMADDRSPGQRRHDALLEAGQRLLRSDTLPASGGTSTTVLVTIDVDQLRSAVAAAACRADRAETGHRGGYARTAGRESISIAELLHLAAEADIIPVVCDDAGGVLAYGRTIRTASSGQRRVLTARDGGCCFPGCTRPATWCQAHHVVPWQRGGLTDVANLCLLCTYHHREFERRGWTVEMSAGTPQWRPPAWLDPDRRPVRNTAHHPPDIDFRVVDVA